MGYVIIAVCIIAALAIVAVVYLKTRKAVEKQELIVIGDNNEIAQSLVDDYSANEMIVMVEQLPVETIEDESKLMEITDSKVLARVNNLVVGLVQAGNAVNNASQAVKENGEVFYRAIIPAGAKLTDSKAMEGAVRGFYRGTDQHFILIQCLYVHKQPLYLPCVSHSFEYIILRYIDRYMYLQAKTNTKINYLQPAPTFLPGSLKSHC